VENGYNFPSLNVDVTVVLRLFLWCGANLLCWHPFFSLFCRMFTKCDSRHFFSGQKFKILWYAYVVAYDEFVLFGIFSYSLDACGNVCCVFYVLKLK